MRMRLQNWMRGCMALGCVLACVPGRGGETGSVRSEVGRTSVSAPEQTVRSKLGFQMRMPGNWMTWEAFSASPDAAKVYLPKDDSESETLVVPDGRQGYYLVLISREQTLFPWSLDDSAMREMLLKELPQADEVSINCDRSARRLSMEILGRDKLVLRIVYWQMDDRTLVAFSMLMKQEDAPGFETIWRELVASAVKSETEELEHETPTRLPGAE